MAAFLYRCPTTGYQVQGWLDHDEPEDDGDIYEGITCPLCQRLHFANPKTRFNLVFSKALCVLEHAEFFEPLRKVLHCAAPSATFLGPLHYDTRLAS
jgi:hypothetical protein